MAPSCLPKSRGIKPWSRQLRFDGGEVLSPVYYAMPAHVTELQVAGNFQSPPLCRFRDVKPDKLWLVSMYVKGIWTWWLSIGNCGGKYIASRSQTDRPTLYHFVSNLSHQYGVSATVYSWEGWFSDVCRGVVVCRHLSLQSSLNTAFVRAFMMPVCAAFLTFCS